MLTENQIKYIDNTITLLQFINTIECNGLCSELMYDDMELIYHKLSETELKQIEDIAGDLYSIYDKAIYFKIDNINQHKPT